MPKFNRRPRVCEALQLSVDITLHTQDGERKGSRGDWLVVGHHGDLYVVDGDTFAELYEPADEEAVEAMRRTGRRR